MAIELKTQLRFFIITLFKDHALFVYITPLRLPNVKTKKKKVVLLRVAFLYKFLQILYFVAPYVQKITLLYVVVGL